MPGNDFYFHRNVRGQPTNRKVTLLTKEDDELASIHIPRMLMNFMKENGRDSARLTFTYTAITRMALRHFAWALKNRQVDIDQLVEKGDWNE